MIVFAHRSFQEYFVARFICNAKLEVQQMLIDKYAKTLHRDSVMELLYEMNPELVERHLIIPGIEKIERYLKLKKKVGITHYVRFIKSEYTHFEFSGRDIRGAHSTSYHGFSSIISFALHHCGHIIGWKGFGDKDKEEIQYLTSKYGKKSGPGTWEPIPVSHLSYKDDFIRDLASKGRFFSLRTLELAIEIKKALIKKHQDLDDSLEQILMN